MSRSESTMRDMPQVLNNAMNLRMMKEQIELVRQEQKIKQATVQGLKTDNATKLIDQAIRVSQRQVQEGTQPHQIRLTELQRIIGDLSLTGLRNQQQLEQWLSEMGGLGGASNAAGIAKFMLQLMRGRH